MTIRKIIGIIIGIFTIISGAIIATRFLDMAENMSDTPKIILGVGLAAIYFIFGWLSCVFIFKKEKN